MFLKVMFVFQIFVPLLAKLPVGTKIFYLAPGNEHVLGELGSFQQITFEQIDSLISREEQSFLDAR